jgi:hypothetical protein
MGAVSSPYNRERPRDATCSADSSTNTTPPQREQDFGTPHVFSANEKDVGNAGRGGGKFNPLS